MLQSQPQQIQRWQKEELEIKESVWRCSEEGTELHVNIKEKLSKNVYFKTKTMSDVVG